MKKVLLGNEAIVQGALESGLDFGSGYPGCPSAEIGDELGIIAKKSNIYYEQSINEKVALESAIGASFSGLKTLVDMKSFGINVCSDSLFPLAYTGTKGPMVIVVGDDPSCWSSAQTEQNSRGYAYLSHIPVLEPSDPQECLDFTKLGFKISEKFNTPIILRTTTRVAHQRMPVRIGKASQNKGLNGSFIRDQKRFSTMPPQLLDKKKTLLLKLEKIQEYIFENKINKVMKSKTPKKIGIIVSGVSFLYVKEALKDLELDIPILKMNVFYPFDKKIVTSFLSKLNKVLVIEELDGYLEKEIKAISKIKVVGKELLSEVGELNTERVELAIASFAGKKIEVSSARSASLPKRYPGFCKGCPHLFTLSVVKKFIKDNVVFSGDIGCYMMAGLPPHNIQDFLFSMGSSLGISHGIQKSTDLRVISMIGDGTFFHAGIPGLINAVYNKSKLLVLVLDNRITAMTGHQPNPGMGKSAMQEEAKELKVEEIAKACGVQYVKVIDPVNVNELEEAIRDYLTKDEVSLIVCRRICALLAKKQS